MGEQGRGGEVWTGWWDGMGQQDMERTQEVGCCPSTNQYLAKPEGRQRQGVVLTGGGHWALPGDGAPILTTSPPEEG